MIIMNNVKLDDLVNNPGLQMAISFGVGLGVGGVTRAIQEVTRYSAEYLPEMIACLPPAIYAASEK